MAKRHRGEGTIRLREDGRWEARVRLDNGSRRSYFGKTAAAVAKELLNARKARDEGLPMPGATLTVEAYFTDWLVSVKPKLRPLTWRRYEQYTRLHLVPELGRVKLTALRPEHLERLYAAKMEAGSSALTVRHLHAVLSVALRRAVRLGLVARNVASIAQPPRVPHRDVQTLTLAQVKALLRAAQGDRFEALYRLAVETGMRQGELLGLRWAYIHLDEGFLEVAGALQRTAAGFAIAAPKTTKSRRQVPLTPEAVTALRRHRARQAEERFKLRDEWASEWDLVFCSEVGTPVEHGNLLRRSYWPILLKIKLADVVVTKEERIRKRKGGAKEEVEVKTIRPRVTFHALRHTAATLLLEQGQHPVLVGALLGHARTSTTVDVYSHALPHAVAETANVMQGLLGSKTATAKRQR